MPPRGAGANDDKVAMRQGIITMYMSNVIKPMVLDFLEIFKYRNLIYMLIGKDLKARYRGTILGFMWSFLNPLLTMLTYVLLFSVYLKVELENYSAFLLSGLLPWFWFATAVGESSSVILGNGGLIKKIYLPSEIFPFVRVVSNLLNFLFALPVLIVLLLLLKIEIGAAVAFFPVVVAVQFVFTLGFSLFVASITVRFRDFTYVIPNLLLLWYFMTPIMYPASFVPEKFGFLLWINPFAVLAVAYQDIFVYNRIPDLTALAGTALISIIVFLIGFVTFYRIKPQFAEEV